MASAKRPCCTEWWTRCWSSWSKVEDNNGPVTPRLELDDADDLRSAPLGEKKFIIQFQAMHGDNYGDTLTTAQLQPMTRSVYGTMRFAYPVSRTSHHDSLNGTHTLLAIASPETYTAWVNQDHWPHMAVHMLGNYWKIILVAEVDVRCESAEVALLALRRNLGGRSGSE